ncbi:copper chaperone PCu(A)C [Saccharothrix sp. AJ9571]|nr:copper chaperone PCu(A)C [Saccharothrix sp. AJ9571]
MRQQKRRVLGVAALGLGAALALAGCGAGQITQTDTQLSAVTGGFADLGKIAVRDAKLTFPGDAAYYPAGADAPVELVVTNSGPTDDELVAVTAEGATGTEIQGFKALVAGSKLTVSPMASLPHDHGAAPATPVAPPPAPPSQQPPSAPNQPSGANQPPVAPAPPPAPAPAHEDHPVGHAVINLLGLKAPVYPGQTLKLTLTFRDAGSIVVDVPIASSTRPRLEHGGEGEHGGEHSGEQGNQAGAPADHGDPPASHSGPMENQHENHGG